MGEGYGCKDEGRVKKGMGGHGGVGSGLVRSRGARVRRECRKGWERMVVWGMGG